MSLPTRTGTLKLPGNDSALTKETAVFIKDSNGDYYPVEIITIKETDLSGNTLIRWSKDGATLSYRDISVNGTTGSFYNQTNGYSADGFELIKVSECPFIVNDSNFGTDKQPRFASTSEGIGYINIDLQYVNTGTITSRGLYWKISWRIRNCNGKNAPVSGTIRLYGQFVTSGGVLPIDDPEQTGSR